MEIVLYGRRSGRGRSGRKVVAHVAVDCTILKAWCEKSGSVIAGPRPPTLSVLCLNLFFQILEAPTMSTRPEQPILIFCFFCFLFIRNCLRSDKNDIESIIYICRFFSPRAHGSKKRLTRSAEVIEISLCGCVTWTLKAEYCAKLQTAHRQVLLRVLGFHRRFRTDHATISYAKSSRSHVAKASIQLSVDGALFSRRPWRGKSRRGYRVR